ncbi:MAG: hypothetical protein OEU36_11970 [Gammaproteobacteria bacterium]|nr:hypothetical protein [Gammaproteobacteria bacterium]
MGDESLSSTVGTKTAQALVLGKTDEYIDCSEPVAANAVIAELIRQAQHTIMLLAPVLDMPVFNSAETATRLANFVAQNPRNRAQFLLGDEMLFIRHSPRLVELFRKFSTFLQVRMLTSEYLHTEEMFLVVDEIGYFRQSAGRPPIVAHMNSRAQSRQLVRRFNELWEFGEHLRELHPLGL